MPTLQIDPLAPDPQLLARAAEVLRLGGLVAFPTETVYGLGGNALDREAVRRIFAAKGRPSYNPLIAHLADAEAARRLVLAWPESAARLAAAFWPGPLTLVLPKRPEVPDEVTAGLSSVAVRVPAHPVAHALLRAADLPVAAPSANRFTRISPTTAQHVEKALGDRVDLILDGGPTSVGIESTVLDLTGERPRLLRPGSISVAELQRIAGEIEVAAPQGSGTAPRPSPGMLDRHYAPRAELRIFPPEEREQAADLARRATAEGSTVGALLLSPLATPVQHPLRMPDEPTAYAQRLYAALHDLDDRGCELILVEQVPDAAEWAGVRDRLQRASR
ncbi:MAG TPA: L-threonylcarbamoyladenylate synthase [Longimicrobiaceae bacterium]|nr:L-threonylcarbamoyladenylate synthase [Longimicrobiaceae bacterium]